ncbi:MAG: insulinase family protein [Bacteroidales bacterium]|nr:insulinase family protein [Bacteroidales bacterium]
MIEFLEHTLDNGLKIIVHSDQASELAAINMIYDVGARDENPDKTGFAHLFEHLMFGGSANIPVFDEPLQLVGGENNAFTNNDFTNYYITLPHQNLETAFWMESDRMLQLDFSQSKLDIQKKVVIEEFNQRYFNQPYGDIWLLLRPMAYKTHPYQWATIGKDIAHIEQANLGDVKDFFYKHYAPNNAILSLSGKIDPDKTFRLAEKWFGDIPTRDIQLRNLAQEPIQEKARMLEVTRNVPADVVYIAFHMGSRESRDFYLADMLSDILSNGASSRLYRRFIKEEQSFTEVNAFITSDRDAGLFILTGKPKPGLSIQDAAKMIKDEARKLCSELLGQKELEKVKNKIEANYTYGQTSILNKAMNLGFFGLLGNPHKINQELNRYLSVEAEELRSFAERTLRDSNSSTLFYLGEKND